MGPRLLLVGIAVSGAFCVSAVLYAKEKTASSLVQLVGAGFLVIVLLVHVAEAFHLLPSMGWGLPSSAGHYVDLVSAFLGLILFTLGYSLRRLAKRRASKMR